jgi:hypothetical protein
MTREIDEYARGGLKGRRWADLTSSRHFDPNLFASGLAGFASGSLRGRTFPASRVNEAPCNP